jgi:transcriptional regulator with XRE-family HTH domain
MEKLSQYLTQKFIEWQGELRQRKTMEEFAAHLNVSRSLLSYWMNGTREPSRENIDKLANVFGAEIYDIMKIPRPDPFVSYVQKSASNLKENQKRTIKDMIAKYLTTNEKDATTSRRID